MLELERLYPNPAAPGQWVHVHGRGFDGQARVVLHRDLPLAVDSIVYDGRELGFRLPDKFEARGTIQVEVVVGPEKASLELELGIPADPPTISEIRPAAAKPGEVVYIHGSGFVHGKTQVTVAGVPGSIPAHVNGPAELNFKVPEGACSGPLQVVTPNGVAQESPLEIA